MRRRDWILLALSCCALPACGTGADPADPLPLWITEFPADAEYPAREFLVGLGSAELGEGRGEARTAAEQAARAEIARVLRTELTAVLETYLESVGKDQAYVNREALQEQVLVRTDAELRGAGTVRTWTGPDRLWVKVALSKEQWSRFQLSEIEGDLAGIVTPDPDDLPALLRMHARLTPAVSRLAEAQAVLGTSNTAGRRVATQRADLLGRLEENRAALTGLNRQIEVKVLSGADQRALPGGRLVEPLQVLVTRTGQPLSGFPVVFTVPGHPRARILQVGQTTNGQGVAAAQVLSVPLQGETGFELEARLDYQRYSPDYPRDRTPSVTASFALPELAGRRVVVEIGEVYLGKNGRPTGRTGTTIEEGLGVFFTDQKARLVRVQGVPSRDLLGGDVEVVCRALEGQADYLLRGATLARPSRATRSTFFSYAGGTLELIDVQRRLVLASIDEPSDTGIKGAHARSQEDASGRALETLRDLLLRKLRRELASLFTLAPDT